MFYIEENLLTKSIVFEEAIPYNNKDNLFRILTGLGDKYGFYVETVGVKYQILEND